MTHIEGMPLPLSAAPPNTNSLGFYIDEFINESSNLTDNFPLTSPTTSVLKFNMEQPSVPRSGSIQVMEEEDKPEEAKVTNKRGFALPPIVTHFTTLAEGNSNARPDKPFPGNSQSVHSIATRNGIVLPWPIHVFMYSHMLQMTGSMSTVPMPTVEDYLPLIPSSPLLLQLRHYENQLMHLNPIEENDRIETVKRKVAKAQDQITRYTPSRPVYEVESMQIARIIAGFNSDMFLLILSEDFSAILESSVGFLASEDQSSLASATSFPHSIRSLFDFTYFISRVVAISSSSSSTPHLRARAISCWIEIATHLYGHFADYQGLYAILSALDSDVIARLENTWDLVSTELKLKLNSLLLIMHKSENNGFASYQESLSTKTHYIPFLPAFVEDLMASDKSVATLIREEFDRRPLCKEFYDVEFKGREMKVAHWLVQQRWMTESSLTGLCQKWEPSRFNRESISIDYLVSLYGAESPGGDDESAHSAREVSERNIIGDYSEKSDQELFSVKGRNNLGMRRPSVTQNMSLGLRPSLEYVPKRKQSLDETMSSGFNTASSLGSAGVDRPAIWALFASTHPKAHNFISPTTDRAPNSAILSPPSAVMPPTPRGGEAPIRSATLNKSSSSSNLPILAVTESESSPAPKEDGPKIPTRFSIIPHAVSRKSSVAPLSPIGAALVRLPSRTTSLRPMRKSLVASSPIQQKGLQMQMSLIVQQVDVMKQFQRSTMLLHRRSQSVPQIYSTPMTDAPVPRIPSVHLHSSVKSYDGVFDETDIDNLYSQILEGPGYIDPRGELVSKSEEKTGKLQWLKKALNN